MMLWSIEVSSGPQELESEGCESARVLQPAVKTAAEERVSFIEARQAETFILGGYVKILWSNTKYALIKNKKINTQIAMIYIIYQP